MILLMIILHVISFVFIWIMQISTSLKMFLSLFFLIKIGINFLPFEKEEENQVFILNLSRNMSAIFIILLCIMKSQKLIISTSWVIGMTVLVCMNDFLMFHCENTRKKGGELS